VNASSRVRVPLYGWPKGVLLRYAPVT
jgi:hypothetical protein